MKLKLSVAPLICALLLAAACGKKESSPTETFKTFFEAAKRKDVVAMKATMSRRMLQSLEEQARQESKPFDEFLLSVSLPPNIPEIRNEKIEGDTATIEIKYEGTDSWRPLKFVKEDGSWKLDSD